MGLLLPRRRPHKFHWSEGFLISTTGEYSYQDQEVDSGTEMLTGERTWGDKSGPYTYPTGVQVQFITPAQQFYCTHDVPFIPRLITFTTGYTYE